MLRKWKSTKNCLIYRSYKYLEKYLKFPPEVSPEPPFLKKNENFPRNSSLLIVLYCSMCLQLPQSTKLASAEELFFL